jgi:hypothetical protein
MIKRLFSEMNSSQQLPTTSKPPKKPRQEATVSHSSPVAFVQFYFQGARYGDHRVLSVKNNDEVVGSVMSSNKFDNVVAGSHLTLKELFSLGITKTLTVCSHYFFLTPNYYMINSDTRI